jgi:putative transposase
MTQALDTDHPHKYNTSRLMHRLGRIPPAEYEVKYYAEHRADQPVAHK